MVKGRRAEVVEGRGGWVGVLGEVIYLGAAIGLGDDRAPMPHRAPLIAVGHGAIRSGPPTGISTHQAVDAPV